MGRLKTQKEMEDPKIQGKMQGGGGPKLREELGEPQSLQKTRGGPKGNLGTPLTSPRGARGDLREFLGGFGT